METEIESLRKSELEGSLSFWARKKRVLLYEVKRVDEILNIYLDALKALDGETK